MGYLSAGGRIFFRSLRCRFKGFNRIQGSSVEILKECINRCWNSRYFQASNGNFKDFYTRDFGFSTSALIKLGYESEVVETLSWALDSFGKHNKLTTTISPAGIPFNVAAYSSDTLALLLRSLRLAKAKHLVHKHQDFLQQQIDYFFHNIIDRTRGLVKTDLKLSSIKDHTFRSSSCYDNVMASIAQLEAKRLGFHVPHKFNYRKLIKKHFWTGSYFLDDLSGSKHIAGDANIFPFWANLYNCKMQKAVFASIHKEKLDVPFPLKYASSRLLPKKVWFAFLAPNYEGNTLWTNIGCIYISLLKQIDKKLYKNHLSAYKRMLQTHGTFLELYFADGKPYKSPFYYSDEGMLWGSILLQELLSDGKG